MNHLTKKKHFDFSHSMLCHRDHFHSLQDFQRDHFHPIFWKLPYPDLFICLPMHRHPFRSPPSTPLQLTYTTSQMIFSLLTKGLARTCVKVQGRSSGCLKHVLLQLCDRQQLGAWGGISFRALQEKTKERELSSSSTLTLF